MKTGRAAHLRPKPVLLVILLLTSWMSRGQLPDDGVAACQHTRLKYFGSLPNANRAARIQYPGDATIDITYYKLELTITATPHYLRGAVTIGFLAVNEGLSRFYLDLADAMTVDSVKTGVQKLVFSQQNNQLTITPAQPPGKNQGLMVTVYYQGKPDPTGMGSFVFGTHGSQNQPVIWSLSEPYGARDWFPCKDTPADKADSSDVWITAPKQFVSVSNGKLEGTTDNPDDTRTYRWRNRYPIANYLISVAMSNYVLYEQLYRPAVGDPMPVTHYLYPEALSDNLRRTLDETTSMLTVFTDYFGPYPFLKEKYGHAQFGWGGGMEHQTISSMGAFNTDIIAHELAHQWFGDKITCRSWEHIWLNEGFASYAEILYRQVKSGPSVFSPYLNSYMLLARRARGTLYVEDITNANNIFDSNRTYYKGAMVLHMLRGIVGDQKFREILRTYAASEFAYGTATTEDFAAIASNVYGQSLDYFFKQWVYGENYPTYRVKWSSGAIAGLNNMYQIQLKVEQTTNTTNPTFFTMPVPVKVLTTGGDGDTLITVFNNSANQTFELTVKGKPEDVQIDPDNWILKQVEITEIITAVAEPVPTTQLTVLPNPIREQLTAQLEVANLFTGRISLTNSAGQELLTTADRSFAAGRHTLSWPVVNLPAGQYYLTLVAGENRVTKTVLITK
ncbi:M1 family aminopeptidase [Larkinella bovis]|uniref:Aminopeptidase N n=1 Tax=Larkinella bovis TaxID=683041 RepID=A0ABW0IFP5_9BACT